VISTVGFGSRFYYYAKRVKEVRLETDVVRIDPAVFTAWFEAGDAFPRLSRLHLNSQFITKPHSTTVVNGFLQPSTLTCLSIHHPRGCLERSQSRILEACASTLTELKLTGTPRNAPLWSDFQHDLLSGTRSLRRLWTDAPISRKGFVGLAANLGLESLRVQCAIDPLDVPQALPPGAFENLRDLCLTGSSEEVVERLLACLSSNHVLISFDMALSRTSEFPRLDSVIAQIGSHKSLERVGISINISSRVHLKPTLEWSTAFFGHLQRLPNLMWLNITPQGSFLPLSSAIVRSLVSQCPHIIHWRIASKAHLSYHAKITLQDFLDILACRPDITVLPVMIDTSVLPSEAARALFGSHSYGPDLMIETTEVTPELEDIILTLFPRVRNMSTPYTVRPKLLCLS
jgi:hypothetical protein